MEVQGFEGHGPEIEHLLRSARAGRLAHAYLFCGARGCGKKTLARLLAQALFCEAEEGERPCGLCPACKRFLSGNHPDVRALSPKGRSIGVDEVRELMDYLSRRPYEGRWHVAIVERADKMTPSAQNALLKTLEEPPEYAVIMLLTSNADALLPTIRSRCVRLDLKVVDDSLVKKYLMERLHVPDYQAEIDASFAQGSIGKAKEAATSEEFSKITENALKILKYANTMEVYELADEIKRLSGEKQNISDYLDIFQFWFRDVLMFKATREIDNLVFKQEINFIKEQASQRSYENLEKILEALEKTKVRLRANVNFELALELLFLTIRER